MPTSGQSPHITRLTLTNFRNYAALSIELEPGMVVTVEPGLYIAPDAKRVPARFRGIGIRIEDDVVVGDGEPEVISAAAPKDPDRIEALMAAAR